MNLTKPCKTVGHTVLGRSFWPFIYRTLDLIEAYAWQNVSLRRLSHIVVFEGSKTRARHLFILLQLEHDVVSCFYKLVPSRDRVLGLLCFILFSPKISTLKSFESQSIKCKCRIKGRFLKKPWTPVRMTGFRGSILRCFSGQVVHVLYRRDLRREGDA